MRVGVFGTTISLYFLLRLSLTIDIWGIVVNAGTKTRRSSDKHGYCSRTKKVGGNH